MQAAGGRLSRPGEGLKASLEGTQGYDAQRALVSPGGAEGNAPAGGAGEAEEAAALDAADKDAATPDLGSGGKGASGAGGAAGAGGQAAAGGAPAAVDLDKFMQQGGGEASADSGAILAPRGGGGGGKISGKPTWPVGVPRYPVARIWVKSPTETVTLSSPVLERYNAYDAAEMMGPHNRWVRSLSPEQLLAVEHYYHCVHQKRRSACVSLGQREATDDQRRFTAADVEALVANINTQATRVGAMADFMGAHLDFFEHQGKAAKIGTAERILGKVSTWLGTLASKIGYLATLKGLATDLVLVGAAVARFARAKPDEYDAALKGIGDAVLALGKDLLIVAVPPMVGTVLSVANAVLSECNPNWLPQLTAGSIPTEPPTKRAPAKRKRRKRKSRRPPPSPSGRGSGRAARETINFNNMYND